MKLKTPDVRLLGLLYLGLPNLIFFWGWLHILWAFLASLVLLWGFFIAHNEVDSFQVKPKTLIGMMAFSLFLAYLSGMGGFIPQQDDYLKHNQLWQDLANLDWPIAYHFHGKDWALSYYLAYYLPAAALAKVFGAAYLPLFSFLWGMSGILIVSLWAYKLIGKNPWILLFVLLLFGGQDFLWRVFVEIRFFFVAGEWGNWNWDEMGLPYEAGLGHKLPTHFGALSWAPQHFLPGALAGLFIIEDFSSNAKTHKLPFVQVLTLLWSPFVSIGMFFFVLIRLWDQRKALLKRIPHLIPAVLTAIPIVLFFLAHHSMDEKGFVWDKSEDSLWPVYFLFFMLMKFLPLWALLVFGQKGKPFSRKVLNLCCIWLVLSMFYWMGHANDFYMRASIPAWFILSIFLARELIGFEKKQMRKYLLLLWFVGGAIIPFSKMVNHSKAMLGEGRGFARTEADSSKVFIQIKEIYTERGLIGKDSLWDQYVGDPEAAFFDHLSKPLKVISERESSLFLESRQ